MDEAEDEDASPRKRKRAPAEIPANEPLFPVQVLMYDPQKQESVEPQLQ
jgi:hypothetical protein